MVYRSGELRPCSQARYCEDLISSVHHRKVNFFPHYLNAFYCDLFPLR
jgi:hypothetical protein